MVFATMVRAAVLVLFKDLSNTLSPTDNKLIASLGFLLKRSFWLSYSSFKTNVSIALGLRLTASQAIFYLFFQ